MNSDFVLKFWDRKILKWERLRYGNDSEELRRKHNSVAARLRWAIKLIEQLPRTTRILDLGCGSGLLLEHLQSLGFTHLTGIDISPKALGHAKSRGLNAKIIVGDVLTTPWTDADLIVALGLSDWVQPRLLAQRMRRDFKGKLLISFSERRPSIKRCEGSTSTDRTIRGEARCARGIE